MCTLIDFNFSMLGLWRMCFKIQKDIQTFFWIHNITIVPLQGQFMVIDLVQLPSLNSGSNIFYGLVSSTP